MCGESERRRSGDVGREEASSRQDEPKAKQRPQLKERELARTNAASLAGRESICRSRTTCSTTTSVPATRSQCISFHSAFQPLLLSRAPLSRLKNNTDATALLRRPRGLLRTNERRSRGQVQLYLLLHLKDDHKRNHPRRTHHLTSKAKSEPLL